MRRWPSCTNTIPATTASTRNGIITLKTWFWVFHQAWMPAGRRETIEAKISSEMPLPMPRWVISSPIHISSTQPVVRQITIRKMCGASKWVTTDSPALACSEWNRNT